MIKKKRSRNPNLKLFQILNDEIFWEKFKCVNINPYRLRVLRSYRKKFLIPSNNILKGFIEDEYKLIMEDNRDTKEIFLELLSE